MSAADRNRKKRTTDMHSGRPLERLAMRPSVPRQGRRRAGEAKKDFLCSPVGLRPFLFFGRFLLRALKALREETIHADRAPDRTRRTHAT
jgi:hypothetical protein